VIHTVRFRGLPALRLLDDAVRLTVLPAWGGKVAEIFDCRRGLEWLSGNPAFSYERCGVALLAYGADYVGRFDVGGFDECFPAVGQCLYPTEPYRGTPLPDHGGVWSVSWESEVEGDSLRLITRGERLPYRLEKTVRVLAPGTIRFDYRAANLTPFPMAFLWSSHSLFAISPGLQLELPVTAMRVFFAPSFPSHHGDRIPWPQFGELDLSRVPRPDAGIAVKLFSPSLTEGCAELYDAAHGAAFLFEFDPALVTHVGLWLNNGGWAGVPGSEPYFNLGLELCIGAPDTLDTAVNHWRAFGELAPRGSRAWWLQVTVS